MQTLVSKLEQISQETGEGQKATASTKGGDEFLNLKKKIAHEVKGVRDKLRERDELLNKGVSGTKATVQMSHQIRSQLKEAREDANRLMQLQRKEARVLPPSAFLPPSFQEDRESENPCPISHCVLL